ncbi:MAG: glutamate synthase subunit beta [Alphaproteobacteria bacterium]|nr:glutamate synthase subunit beta [Alphaproteobacteria bacterium]
MGKPTGFLEFGRSDRGYAPVDERIKHYGEFFVPLTGTEISTQSSRCMDCGIPYCHQGCPVNNVIPEWNDLVYRNKWREGLTLLHTTNNFPEFTGRVCPAPCETSCTLNLTDEPVTIKSIECALVDRGWQEGWIKAQLPSHRSGKRVAVVGSGPAGLAAAQQLARAGHKVVVYEKNARIGGLLRIGIPDFKMEKSAIDRRMAQMQAEGVEFLPNSHVGVNVPLQNMMEEFDAIALCGGSEIPRDLPIPGRELDGVHFAMEFLSQQNDRIAGLTIADEVSIVATGKHVVVIGGGDTGSDCVGTSRRQGAASITQLEVMPSPPEQENKAMIWPDWPNKLRTSSSHQEGVDRDWSVLTKTASGEKGRVTALQCVRLDWVQGEDGRQQMKEIPGSEFGLKADLVFLAMGFVNPVHDGLLTELGVAFDERGNVAADTEDYRTSVDKGFAAGDMRRGQSLVVWAIREGRQCARAIDEYLMGTSELPR